MVTITLPHPDLISEDIAPERAPVGSLVPMPSFYGAAQNAKDGTLGVYMRDGFYGRDATPNPLRALLGKNPNPQRSLDMEVALDASKIDRSRVFFEVFQGDITMEKVPDDEAKVDNDLRGSIDDIKHLDGYWVAVWDDQTKRTGLSLDDLILRRVL